MKSGESFIYNLPKCQNPPYLQNLIPTNQLLEFQSMSERHTLTWQFFLPIPQANALEVELDRRNSPGFGVSWAFPLEPFMQWPLVSHQAAVSRFPHLYTWTPTLSYQVLLRLHKALNRTFKCYFLSIPLPSHKQYFSFSRYLIALKLKCVFKNTISNPSAI